MKNFIKVISLWSILIVSANAEDLTSRMSISLDSSGELKVKSNYLTYYLIRGVDATSSTEGNEYKIINPSDVAVDFNLAEFNGEWNGIFPDVDFKAPTREFEDTDIDLSSYKFPKGLSWKNSSLVIRGASITSLASNGDLNTEDKIVLVIYNLLGLVNTSVDVLGKTSSDNQRFKAITKLSEKISSYKDTLKSAEIYLSLAKVSIEQIKNIIEVIDEDNQELQEIIENMEFAVQIIDKLARIANVSLSVNPETTKNIRLSLLSKYNSVKINEVKGQLVGNSLDSITSEFANLYKDETDAEKKQKMLIKFALEPMYALSSIYQTVLADKKAKEASSTEREKLQKQINFLQYGNATLMLASVIFAGEDFLEMSKKEPKKLIEMLVAISKGLAKDILTIENATQLAQNVVTSNFVAKSGKLGQQLNGKVLKGAPYLKAVSLGSSIGNKLLPMIWDIVLSPSQFKMDIIDGALNRFGMINTKVEIYNAQNTLISQLSNEKDKQNIVLDLNQGDSINVYTNIEQKKLFDESISPWIIETGVAPRPLYEIFVKTPLEYKRDILCVRKVLGDLDFAVHYISGSHYQIESGTCGAGSWFGSGWYDNTETSKEYNSLSALPQKYKVQSLYSDMPNNNLSQISYTYQGGIEHVIVSIVSSFSKSILHDIKIVPTIDNLDFDISLNSDNKTITVDNQNIQFSQDDPMNEYTWDWGDGSSSNESYDELTSMTHTYEDDGVYNVSLTLWTQSGLKKVLEKEIAVGVVPLKTSTIKKTGQTKSYDENGDVVTDGSVKDDGHYQKGVTPNYEREGEIVTDHITGLIWQDNEEAKTIKKQWLTDDNYNDCRDNGNNCENTSGDTAKTYCSNLTLGGYDWRLPSSKELESIQDYNRYNPSINPIFENTSSNYYWSSTSSKGNSNYAWRVGFGYGSVGYGNGKYDNNFVRCVRAGE